MIISCLNPECKVSKLRIPSSYEKIKVKCPECSTVFPYPLLKRIVICKNSKCRGQLRIPVLNKKIKADCPRCRESASYLPIVGYLDIETTSLKYNQGDLILVGIYLDSVDTLKLEQLYGEKITVSELKKIIKSVDIVYTYNGKKFDLPFIKAKTGLDIESICQHRDLMYDMRKRNLKGGLKEVEKKIGIKRKTSDITGRDIVSLWYKYQEGDATSLKKLLEYNEEDVRSLIKIRERFNL